MFRYLKEAFWARPDLGGLGRIPWNALIVGGAVVSHLLIDDTSTTTTSTTSGPALEN